jgi:hypothetical protein
MQNVGLDIYHILLTKANTYHICSMPSLSIREEAPCSQGELNSKQSAKKENLFGLNFFFITI